MFTWYKPKIAKNINKQSTIYEIEQLKLSHSNNFFIWSFTKRYELCAFL